MGTTITKIETHPAIFEASVMQIEVDIAQVSMVIATQVFLENFSVVRCASLSRKADDVGLTAQVEPRLVRTWRNLNTFTHLVLFTIPEVILDGFAGFRPLFSERRCDCRDTINVEALGRESDHPL